MSERRAHQTPIPCCRQIANEVCPDRDVEACGLKVAYRPADTRTRSPLAKAVRSMTSVASRNFVKAYRQGAVVSGAQRTVGLAMEATAGSARARSAEQTSPRHRAFADAV